MIKVGSCSAVGELITIGKGGQPCGRRSQPR